MLEILIPGLILVALMVYVSTRIKRNAAAAFEAERISTDEFALEKPEGFLHVLNGDSRYAVELYSNKFGTGDAANVRAAEAKLVASSDRTADEFAAETLDAADDIKDDRNEVIDGLHYRVMDTRRADGEIGRSVLTKVVEKNGRAFKFEIIALEETTDEVKSNIEAMFNSFELK